MVRVYGNWCGPNWTAGKHKAAKDLTEEDKKVPAKNALDQCCKTHDIELSEAKTDREVEMANYKFIQTASQDSTFGKTLAIAVKYFGPKTVQDVQAGQTYDLAQAKKMLKNEDISTDEETKNNDEEDLNIAAEIVRSFNPPETPENKRIKWTTPDAPEKSEPNMTPAMKRTRNRGNELMEDMQIMDTLYNLQARDQMDSSASETSEITAKATAGSTSLGSTRKETPVLPLYNSLPFRDVTQTRLKNYYFFSVNDLQWTSGTTSNALGTSNRYVKIRMNDFRNAFAASLNQQVGNTLVKAGVSTNAMAGRYQISTVDGSFLQPDTLIPFPETNLYPENFTPQMWKYYKNLYNAMSIVKVYWKLHVDFPNAEYSEIDYSVTSQTSNYTSTKTVVDEQFMYPQADSNINFPAPSNKRDFGIVNETMSQIGTAGLNPLNNAVSANSVWTRQKTNTHNQTTTFLNGATTVTPNQAGSQLSYRTQYSPRPQGARISMHYETKSGTGGVVESNMPVPCHIMDMERWPAICDRHTIYNADRGGNGSSHHTFSGTWTPNWQNHNPLNDDQIKTWIGTDNLNGDLFKEYLVVQFFRSWDTPKSTWEKIGLNCYMEVNYDVQFRGLKEAALWPMQGAYTYGGTQATIDLDLPVNTRYTNDDGATNVPTRSS